MHLRRIQHSLYSALQVAWLCTVWYPGYTPDAGV